MLSYAQAPDTVWTRTFGGTDYDAGYSLQETLDYGYIITGFTTSDTAGVYLIKTDATGSPRWTKVYQTSAFGGRSVQQTFDGGYIVAGHRNGIWILRTDSLGDTLWTRTYDAPYSDICHSVVETTDSGFAFVWDQQAGMLCYIRFVKLDVNGNFLWVKDFGQGHGYSLQQTSDDGFIIAGDDYSGIYLIRTDDMGDTIWTKNYGDGSVHARSIRQTFDGGYVVTGDKGNDVFLMKADNMGDSTWTRTYGGDSIDRAKSVWQTADSGYFITGLTQSFGMGNWDFYLIKTNSNGDVIWTKILGGVNSDVGWQGQQTYDGDYVITGYTASFGSGCEDLWLMKIGTAGDISEKASVVSANINTVSIISGPLVLPRDKYCKVFDIMGRVVLPDKIEPGIYFLEIDGEIQRKVVKIK
jgi:photosystem II stability/assembly factor-like uncharacterized protein